MEWLVMSRRGVHGYHLTPDSSGPLKIVLRAGANLAKDNFFGGPAT